MKKVVILKGLPASGKSSWCKELIDKEPGRYKRVSKDDLRAMLDNGRWSKGNEQFILKVRDALILQALQEGYHLLIDDTNLHPKHVEAIRELVKGQAVVEIKDFTDVPLETCLERDRKRPSYVGEQVIRRMYRDFLQPKPVPPIYDHSLPDAIICDLDGSLALMNGRNVYDAAKCEEDIVNKPVASILQLFSEDGDYRIILVSGRKEEHRPQTERWLANHYIHYDALFMRSTEDNRKDSIIKRELYEQHIQGRYNVSFVIDDRLSVTRLWRDDLGLTCFQVDYGDY